MNNIFLFVAAAVANPLPNVRADEGAISTIMTLVFTITGAIAALVITVAGFRYVLSHGDPNLIAQSKQAIVYASIGLVVSISGAAIVNFVLGAL